jgi:hypothetical protein
MPRPEAVTIGLTGIELTDASTGQPVQLTALGGVHILVLLRHRH